MQHKKSEQLIIVHNSNSTRANRADEKVFVPLEKAGIPFEIYETTSADTEENIAHMQTYIPAGARVIDAAGDGTGMQLMNAALRSDKNWTLGYMPLGNFNDHASSHINRDQTILDLADEAAPYVERRPLTIEVNGEYWRHAPAYMTIGWTAIAASQFGDTESRQSMKNAPGVMKLGKSLLQLTGNYFQNGDTFLPDFEVNGVRRTEKTDILVANNPRVGSIVRFSDTFYDKSYFGLNVDIDVSGILKNIPFGLKSISGHTPHERAEQMRLIFDEVAHIPVQTEGEFQWLDAKEIFVYKHSGDVVRVLHPKK
jgi:diacylglycerol kinase family enzyme